jgi:hypothetical protein
MAALTEDERAEAMARLAEKEADYKAINGKPQTTSWSHSNTAGGRSMSVTAVDVDELKMEIARLRKLLGLRPSILFESRQLRPTAISNC